MRCNVPPYPLQPELPLIQSHRHLPHDMQALAHIRDLSLEGNMWSFVRYQDKLILLIHCRQASSGDGQYGYIQREFPLDFLHWFPMALTQYEQRQDPAGEHLVGDELLSLRISDTGPQGLTVTNYSRCQRNYDPIVDFRPQETAFAHHFIYPGGLLALIKQLAKQFTTGELSGRGSVR